MSALTDYQTLRTEKYATITAFIANPEPTSDIPNIISRLSAVEEWILAKELE